MVRIGFKIRRTDPVRVSHTHGDYGRAGTVATTTYGTLAGDQTEIYRNASGAHTEPEFDLISMLRQHISDGHSVFWALGDLQDLDDDASNNSAITGTNWLHQARQLVDRFPPEASAYGRLTYYAGDEPFMAFAIYLDKPLLQQALDLLLEARRLPDAHFVVTMSLEGPRYPHVDLPLPTMEEFVNQASLYGIEVSWGIDSDGMKEHADELRI
jgi:hypothetical protein